MGDCTLVVILGRKKCGKSTLLRRLVLEHVREFRDIRFHVLDSTREWSRPRGVREEQLRIYPATQHTIEEVAYAAVLDAPAVLVVDEIDRYVPNGMGPNWGQHLPWTHAIVNYGRHLQTGLLAATRRQGRVNTDFPSLADTLFVFKTTHRPDLEQLPEEIRDEVAALEPREYVRHDP